MATRPFYIPASSYELFKEFWAKKCKADPTYRKTVRYGQAFYAFFKLERMFPTVEHDRLWESNSKKYVESFVDFNQ